MPDALPALAAPPPRRWLGGASMALAWGALAALQSLQPAFVLDPDGAPREMPWPPRLLGGLQVVAPWLLATPLVLFAMRRTRWSRAGWPVALLVHLGLAALLIGAFVVVQTGQLRHVGITVPFLRTARTALPESLVYYALTMLGCGMMVLRERWEAERRAAEAAERRTATLEAELLRARLETLQSQLRPHFLFNTLNGIVTLIDVRPAEARRMLVLLGDLLRATLSAERRPVVPLRDEIAWLTCYLDLMRMRFEDRLRIELAIDPETLALPVPALLLQPLVENAMTHGVDPTVGTVHLAVEAHLTAEGMQLVVRDDGRAPSGPGGFGIGLSNTRARLGALYGERWTLTLTPLPHGGTEARVVLPADGVPA